MSIFRTVLLASTVLAPSAAFGQTALEDGASRFDDDVIIVTARKRTETLQEVPTAVAVATAETINNLGLDSVGEIAKTTPGLVFDDIGGRDSNRPVIRGQANILGDSGVAFFIDGIYYTGSIADYDVDTIERIEVVKGPQSALYGRNTYSGAINIISKLPTDTWEGRVTADISEHDRYEVTAGIRGPIGNGLAVGVNGRYFTNGGEYTNLFDGEKVGKQKSYSASGVLSWDNGGPFTALLRGYYNRTDDGQPAIFAQGAEQNNCFFDNGALYRGGGRYFCGVIRPDVINTDYRRQFINADDVGLEADTINASLRLEYAMSDNLTLTSLTGFNDREQTLRTDGDYSPGSFQTAVFARFPISGFPVPPFGYGFVGSSVDFSFASRNKTRDWSQELRLTYESDVIDFLVGGYYFDQSKDDFDIRTVPANAAALGGQSFGAAFAREQAICAANPICSSVVPLFGPSFPNSRAENLLDIRNIAAFGAVTWHITPTLNLGLEGRYSEEKIEQTVFDFDEGDPRPAPVLANAKFTEFTPRVTLDWQATPDNLVYAIYAEGQKPGGFNGAVAIEAGLPIFAPEDVKSYEIGIKNQFLDRSLTANLSLFRNEISGYQLTQNARAGANTTSAITNAGDARIHGLELELIARPSDRVTFIANYALADSKFTRGFDENQGVLNDVADNGLVDCSTGDEFPDVEGCTSAFGSIRGKRIPRAPVHQVFADIDWRAPLGDGTWEVFTGANVSFNSTSFAQVHNLAESGDSVVVDARIGVQSERFKIQAYVDNLTDEDAVGSIIRYADGNLDFRRSFVAGLRPGRRFGVILSAGF